MLELIGEMILCLVVAILLGVLIGWLLAKALSAEEYDIDYDELSVREEEHIAEIKELESKYKQEKKRAEEYLKKNRKLKGELVQKINLLEEKSKVLHELQEKYSSSDYHKELERLKVLLKHKEMEMKEFETVLIKAEQTIERLKANQRD